MCNDDPFFFRIIFTLYLIFINILERERDVKRVRGRRKESMSDKISIFKMATTCGDVVTHLINSQQGVRFDFRWLKCLLPRKCWQRFVYDNY